MVKAAFFSDFNKDDRLFYVYSDEQREQMAGIMDLYPEVITPENFDEHADQLIDLEVIFSTWGMFALSDKQLDCLPNLKALFYAAGDPKGFSQPLVERGVVIHSAWRANAIPVAEFCAAQIVLAMTGFFRNVRNCADAGTMHATRQDRKLRYTGPGNYGAKVTLVGAGAISQRTQELLEPYSIEVIVVPSRMEKRTISLEDACAQSFVVSNHLPDRDDNVGVFNKDIFESMPENSVFINTGRGRQINEDDLVEVLSYRKDLTALLDVQCEEPPAEGSGLYGLDNIQLTQHIAGSKNDEVHRMSDYMIEEFKRWENGEECEHVYPV